MCFNPGPERRVPSPNRYIADAKFCLCKNNKTIIIIWSLQLHELCELHTDNLFPAALAAVLAWSAATVEPSLIRDTARRHRTWPAWASNDAPSKALARTRVPQHLAPRTPDYWAPTHTFVEPGHERLLLET